MNPTFTLTDVRRFWSRHWVTILTGAVLGALISAALTLSTPRVWVAQSELVIGGFGVPVSLQIQGSPEGSGALGLDMPIESSVKIAGSTTVAELAAQDPRLEPGDAAGIGQTVSVRAEDAHGLVIASQGDSPQQAERRTRAIVEALIRYRQDVARSQLKTSENGLRDTISREQTRTSQIERALASASNVNTALTQEYLDLHRLMNEQAAKADELAAFAEGFGGGITVTKPAYTIKGSTKVDFLRTQLVGLFVGALVGSLVAAIRALLGRQRGTDLRRDRPGKERREGQHERSSPGADSPDLRP